MVAKWEVTVPADSLAGDWMGESTLVNTAPVFQTFTPQWYGFWRLLSLSSLAAFHGGQSLGILT